MFGIKPRDDLAITQNAIGDEARSKAFLIGECRLRLSRQRRVATLDNRVHVQRGVVSRHHARAFTFMRGTNMA
jgi:hypothetical protein